jgi:photosystem II stability/assembly factor-like uncharacterized protein
LLLCEIILIQLFMIRFDVTPFFLFLALSISLMSLPASGQWVQTPGPYLDRIKSFEVIGNTLFVGTLDFNIYHSTDNGSTWLRTPIIDWGTDDEIGNIYSLASNDSTIFAGTDVGLLTSDYSGIDFEPKRSSYSAILSLVAIGGNLIAGTSSGVQRSTDGGSTWVLIDTGFIRNTVYSLSFFDSTIYAGTGSGIFFSNDSGKSWQPTDSAVTNDTVLCFAQIGSTLFAGTESHGIFLSTDNGANWSGANAGIANATVYSMASIGSLLFIGSDSGKIFRSTDTGISWTSLNTMLTFPVYALTRMGNTLFAGTDGEGIFRSTDSGASWHAVGIGSPSISAFAVRNKTIYAIGEYVFRSEDTGQSWQASRGLDRQEGAQSIDSIGNILLAGSEEGVFRSLDSGKTWNESGKFGDVASFGPFAKIGTVIFVASGGIFRSSDSGVMWTNASHGMADSGVFALVSVGTKLFAGTYEGFTYQSTDSGQNWNEISHFFSEGEIGSFDALGSTLFAGTRQGLFFRSIDLGVTWDTSVTAINNYVTAVWVDGNLIFAGTLSDSLNSEQLYVSTDTGNTWKQFGSAFDIGTIVALAVVDSNFFIGTNGAGVWRRPLSEMIGSSGVAEVPQQTNTITIYPNPVSHEATIGFTTNAASQTNVTIFDVLGNSVDALFNGTLETGNHSLTWDASVVPPGTYYTRIASGNGDVQTVKIVKE